MLKTYIDSKQINYSVVRSKKRKTIGLSVDFKNGLLIRAPKDASQKEIESTIRNKEDWISKKLYAIGQIKTEPKPKEFVSGERLPYIGRSYRLQIKKSESKKVIFAFYKGKFVVNIPDDDKDHSEKIRKKAINWYKEKALKKLKQRVEIFAARIGKSPTDVKVREFKSRWGTRLEDNIVVFNWRIILAPMSIIDYVIAHELSHLVSHNHSKAFWSKLSTIIIDHEQRSEWLRIYGATLII